MLKAGLLHSKRGELSQESSERLLVVLLELLKEAVPSALRQSQQYFQLLHSYCAEVRISNALQTNAGLSCKFLQVAVDH